MLFYHVWLFRLYDGRDPANSLIDRVLDRVVPVGWIGVDLFFVLSGFLITGILLDAKGKRHFFRHFYGRRVLRIMPLYYAVLGALLILTYARGLSAEPELRALADAQAWYWTHTANVLFMFDGWNRATGHFWSLAMEEQFYLFWPLVVLLLSRRSLLLTCGIMAGVSVGGRVVVLMTGHPSELMFFLLPLRMDALAGGAAIAALVREEKALAVMRRWAPAALAATSVALAAYWLRFGLWHEGLTAAAGLPIAVAFFTALVACAVVRPAGSIAVILERPPLQVFGRYSYAIYLLHQPVLVLWDAPWRLARSSALAISMPLLTDVLCAVVVCAIIFVASCMSWHLMEKHFLKLKRFFPADAGTSGGRTSAPAVAPRNFGLGLESAKDDRAIVA